VHAGGDATGRETIKALAYIVAGRENISFSGHTCLFDIIADENGIAGAVVRILDSEFHFIKTNNLVIATGGIGQLYKSSTNPIVATGDGIAAALRAGASVTNIEFIQFHPTGLWDSANNGSEFLISEAVRGEGGILINTQGKRFMVGVHELAELAPRDIVARGIVRELEQSGESYAYIDITSKPEEFLKKRFPTIYNECLNHGINIAFDKIPVNPIQHYLMGGIDTDINGCTNIEGLYACGEAANTGVHGANRLASNSMLECLVFGRRAAQHINKYHSGYISHDDFRIDDLPSRPHGKLNYKKLRKKIQELMSEHCFVIRSKEGLQKGHEQLGEIYSKLESIYDESTEFVETLNIATVAKTIAEAALNRPESIGSHYMEG
jgi:L-aspartate oxidase